VPCLMLKLAPALMFALKLTLTLKCTQTSSWAPSLDQVKRISLLGTFRTFPMALVGPYVGLILYLKDMPLGLVGVYYLLVMATGATGQLTGGLLSDRMGRRWVMASGQAASGLMLITMGISLVGSGYWPFAASALIQSFFGSASFSAYNTYVGDLGREKRGLVKSYGLARIGINAGWALGPLVGGFLMGTVGYTFAFILSGGLTLASLALVMQLEELKATSFDLRPLRDTTYALSISPLVLVFAFVAQFGFTLTVFETYYSSLSLTEIGFIYLVNGLTVVALQYPIARALSGRDPIRWIGAGLLLYGVAYAMLPVFKGLAWASLSVFVLTLGEDISTPLIMTVANLLADPSRRGSYMGIYGILSSSARSLGSSVGSALMSGLLDHPLELWGAVDSLGLLAGSAFMGITGGKLRKASGSLKAAPDEG